MTDHIEDRLDEALNRSSAMLPMEAGSDAELRDLLQVAAAVRELHQPPSPSNAAIEHGRARMLAELAAQRRNQAKGFTGLALLGVWLSRQLTPALLVRRAGIALVALLLTFALSGVLSVSADSLPGDPLYELKLLQEQVRLSLAPSQNDREAVRDELDRTRARELNEVRQEGRVVRTEISGILEAIRPASIVINGVELPLDPMQFPALQISKPGDRVVVTVQTGADGSVKIIAYQLLPAVSASASATPAALIATMAATILPSNTPIATPTPRPQTEDNPRPTALPNDLPSAAPTATAAPTRAPDERGTITPSRTPDDRETPRASETPRPTDTRQPSQTPDRETPRPTETRESSRTPSPTQTRASSATPPASQTPRPTDTREPTRTLEPSRTPEPTRTLQPTQTPQPTRTLEPTRTPDAEHAPAGTPSPTATRTGDVSSH